MPFEDLEPKRFEHCYVDFDTVVYRAAAMLQDNFILVKHKKTGRTRRFSGVREFRGYSDKGNGGWLKSINDKRIANGVEPLDINDYEIEHHSELKQSTDDSPHVSLEDKLVEQGLFMINMKVKDIKRTMDAEDYTLVIGKGRYFRYDFGKIVPYKGERLEKPLLLAELTKAFLESYGDKVKVIDNTMEADDYVSIKGWESYKHFKRTGKHKYVISYVDKDIKMTPCPYFNYDKIEEGIIEQSVEAAANAYCIQLLIGDITDNIKGLPALTAEQAKLYGVAKGGIGAGKAEIILPPTLPIAEQFKRVVDAYRAFYGDEPFEFTSYDGEVSTRTYIDMLQENAILLYMLRSEDELGTYDIRNTLDKLKIEY